MSPVPPPLPADAYTVEDKVDFDPSLASQLTDAIGL